MGSITDIGDEMAARLGGDALPAAALSLTIDGNVAVVPWKVSMVTLDEELTVTLSAGTGALKLDGSGAALSGNKMTSSGTTLNENTAMLVKVN